MDLYPTPENPLPDGAICLALKTPDGVNLRAMVAGTDSPRGTIVLVGGRGDFMERYFETMRDLMARGFCVASVDLRGQGGSERLQNDAYRGYVKSFSAYDADMRTLMQDVVVPKCPMPYYIIGHSTGGNVVLRLMRKANPFRKAILLSPLIGIRYGAWPRSIAAILVTLATFTGLGWLFLPGQNRRPMGRDDFDRNPLTSDRRRWHRDSGILENAPRLGLGGPTFAWLAAARRSVAAIGAWGRRTRLSAPVLIVASGQDRVVENEAMRRLARRVPGIALCFIPGAQHELLTEADHFRQQALAAVDSFVAEEAVA